MNDQIQNINTEVQAKPLPIFVTDKDGNQIPIQYIGPDEVQDIEYSEVKEGN
jgi:hypothetical protein